MEHQRITLSIPEACNASGLSRTAVYHAIARGELVTFKTGRRRLVHRRDLEAFLLQLRDAGRQQ
jgi:excisionase family DNA binding protein